MKKYLSLPKNPQVTRAKAIPAWGDCIHQLMDHLPHLYHRLKWWSWRTTKHAYQFTHWAKRL